MSSDDIVNTSKPYALEETHTVKYPSAVLLERCLSNQIMSCFKLLETVDYTDSPFCLLSADTQPDSS